MNGTRYALHLLWIATLILSALLYVWPTLIQAQAYIYLADRIGQQTAWQEAQRVRDSLDTERYRRIK
jgi:hypothetical protein